MRFLPAGLLDMGWCGTSKNVGKIKKACATRYITQRGFASLKIPTFSPFFRNNFKKGVRVCPTPLARVRRPEPLGGDAEFLPAVPNLSLARICTERFCLAALSGINCRQSNLQTFV